MSNGGGAPGPSEEERELQRLQIEMLREQQNRQDMLRPILFEELGLEPQFAEANPRVAELQQQREQLEQQFVGADPDERTAIQAQLDNVQQQLDRAVQEGDIVGFERKPDPLEDMRENIQRMQLERTQAALEGELPVSPALEQNLSEQEKNLRARLRDQLGPGFETSTPGIEALAEFEQRSEALREEARRGQLTAAEQMALSREQASGRRLGDFINLASGTAGFGGANTTLDSILGRKRQNRADMFAFEQGQARRRNALISSGATTGAMAAGAQAGGIGGPAGAAMGAGAGLLLSQVF